MLFLNHSSNYPFKRKVKNDQTNSGLILRPAIYALPIFTDNHTNSILTHS